MTWPGLHVRVLHHAVNRGKGAAIRTALEAATGDFIVIQDADLEYEPNDLVRLIRPLADGTGRGGLRRAVACTRRRRSCGWATSS